MKKTIQMLTALVLTFGALLPILQTQVSAQAATALSITPRRELTVQKGATVKESLPVTNPRTDLELTLSLRLVDFSAKNQTGAPSLDLRENAKEQPWSLKKYIDLPETVTLKPGETTNVQFSVTMPANIGAGSYYSAIQYTAAGEGGANVTLAAAATTLVFVNVPGDATEKMTLKQLGAFSGEPNSEIGAFKLFYIGSAPKIISYVLKNEGNVAERPIGSILLKNSFTGKTTKVDQANFNGALALIGQERRFDACINAGEKTEKTVNGEVVNNVCNTPKLTPGRYTITLSAFYGQGNGKSLEILGTSSFWYLPIWFIVLVVAAILALATLVWWIVTKVRSQASTRRR